MIVRATLLSDERRERPRLLDVKDNGFGFPNSLCVDDAVAEVQVTSHCDGRARCTPGMLYCRRRSKWTSISACPEKSAQKPGP